MTIFVKVAWVNPVTKQRRWMALSPSIARALKNGQPIPARPKGSLAGHWWEADESLGCLLTKEAAERYVREYVKCSPIELVWS